MAAITTAIAVAGAAISGVSAVGQMQSTAKASKASRQAEALRAEQKRLDAMRRRRETLRQGIVANSMARARNVAQGAGMGSSVLFGAYGQTAGEVGRQTSYVNTSERIGSGIFDANQDIANAWASAAMFNQAGKFGNVLMTNAQTIGKIGTSLFSGSSGTTVNPWTTTVNPDYTRGGVGAAPY